MGEPPPVVTNQVTYVHEELFGTRFPDIRPGTNPEFVEWMMGLPAGHVTNPDIGLTRSQQLKAIGNGVCVPQGIAALRMLLDQLEGF